MNLKTHNVFAAVAVFLMAVATVHSQSMNYSNTVFSLNPVGYWPLHEVEAAAPGAIETNYGTLGSLGNAYYPDYQVNSGAFIRQMPGALASDPDTTVFFTGGPNNTGSFTNTLSVPHTSPLATVRVPFTLECWYMATNIGTGQGDILSECDASKAKGFRIYYQNNGTNAASVGFTAIFYDLTHPGSGAQINFFGTPTNSWHHLVLACDAATNMTSYIDGIKCFGPTAFAGRYEPDIYEPFSVANGLGNGRAFHGLVDEAAYYPTNLAAADIATHYSDGINASASVGQYFNDVTNDNPLIYLRMDSTPYSVPSVGSWPTFVNYGKTNGVAVGGGVYTPGTMPGMVSLLAYLNVPHFGVGTNAALLSGVGSFADAGYADAYNPTGGAPFTVSAIFRGNPVDTNRVQSIVGHGVNSWELGLAANGFIVFNSGTNSAAAATGTGAGDLVSTTTAYDDGLWHQVVAVHNGTTNVLYVDGQPNRTNMVVANSAGNSLDVMIGSDPSYTNNPAGWGRQFAGEVCDVAFFTNALAAADVQTLYNNSGVLPTISQQPASAAVASGTAFTNTATLAGGSKPLYYQWYTNGVPVGGATNISLVFNPVLPVNASTNYYLIVTNYVGAVTSAVVNLTVYTTPTFVAQYPITYTNLFTLYGGTSPTTVGSTPTFSVSVLGGQPLAYQWATNGVAVGGATGTSFKFTNCQMSSPTNFYCVVSNSFSVVTSMLWSVSYIAAPTAPFPQAVLAAQPVGYWRLNDTDDGMFDGNPGAICTDYESGNNGIYTNVFLANSDGGTGYSPSTDPTETSVQLGTFATTFCDANSIGTNIDFSGSANATFTVAIWANGNGNATRNANAGLVTKGFNNFEEFLIDEGGAAQALRFGVRVGTVGNAFIGANAFSLANNSTWHYVVGVCDEPNTNVTIYVDGRLYASTLVPLNSGLLQSSVATPLRIGDRGPITAPGNSQFKGYLNDAAIYNYAFNPGQVIAQYDAAGGTVAPYFAPALSSTNISVGAASTLIIPVTAAGTPPIGYVWTNITSGGTLAAGVVNTTSLNATLSYANIPISWNGNQLQLIVTNAYGTTNIFVKLSVTNTVNINPTNIVFSVTGGNQLTLSWPADHTGWRLQAQTNALSAGLNTNWVNVSGATTTNQVLMPINAANGSVFYRLVYP